MASKRKAKTEPVRVPFVGPFMFVYGQFHPGALVRESSGGRYLDPFIILPNGEAPEWSDSAFYRNDTIHYFTAPIKSLRPFLDAMKKRRPVPQNYDGLYGHHFVNESGEVVRLIVSSHIADSQIYWPKNNVQPLVMFTTVGETRRDNIEWGNSATRERAANRPATWGVFSQAPNRKLAAEFVEWFERRLGAGQSSGQRRRRA